ncbi:MAG: hypothetical protein AB1689_29160 [Thermodesulfobacteriota bacterium]
MPPARPARRRVGAPYRRKPLRRYSPASLKDALRTFLPPLVGAIVFLLLYILGLLDMMATRPALAIDAFLLFCMVLFFPMRYAHRLSPRGRALAVAFGALWLIAMFYPVHRRIYPAERWFTVDATADDLPITLPTSAVRRFDMLIDGHLYEADPGGARAARYALTLEGDETPSQTFQGEFKETWQRQRQSRSQSVEVLRERRATTVVVENPHRENLRVSSLRVEGQAERVLTLSLHPHRLPPWWLTLAIGASLLAGAVLFDRATGAGETAASLVIATAASFVGAYTFPSIGSPQPTFRELAGAAVVGALLGGPIGGLVAWSARGRFGASRVTLSARAR